MYVRLDETKALSGAFVQIDLQLLKRTSGQVRIIIIILECDLSLLIVSKLYLKFKELIFTHPHHSAIISCAQQLTQSCAL